MKFSNTGQEKDDLLQYDFNTGITN
jgi:hypothetical protein